MISTCVWLSYEGEGVWCENSSEDTIKEMHLNRFLHSVYPYLQRKTEKSITNSKMENIPVNVNKLIKKPGEIGIGDNWELLISQKIILSWNDCRARKMLRDSSINHLLSANSLHASHGGRGRLDEDTHIEPVLLGIRYKWNVFWLQ